MVLKTIKRGRVEFLLEKIDGLSLHKVVLRLLTLHHKLELLALLVIFELLFRINFSIVNIKLLVLEIFLDFETCL